MKKLHVKIYSVTEDEKVICGQTMAGGLPTEEKAEGIQIDGSTDDEIIKKIFLNTLAVVAKTLYPNDFQNKLVELYNKYPYK